MDYSHFFSSLAKAFGLLIMLFFCLPAAAAIAILVSHQVLMLIVRTITGIAHAVASLHIGRHIGRSRWVHRN